MFLKITGSNVATVVKYNSILETGRPIKRCVEKSIKQRFVITKKLPPKVTWVGHLFLSHV